MKTQLEIYFNIYKQKKSQYSIEGLDDNKSSRKAHIFAVKNTWYYYNKQFRNIK